MEEVTPVATKRGVTAKGKGGLDELKTPWHAYLRRKGLNPDEYQ